MKNQQEVELRIYKDLDVLRTNTVKNSVYFVLNSTTQKVTQIWVTNKHNVAKQVELTAPINLQDLISTQAGNQIQTSIVDGKLQVNPIVSPNLSLEVINASTQLQIQLSSGLLAQINNALQAGDNISSLVNDSGFLTDEQAQDVIGNILTDTVTVDLSYNDVLNTISADVKSNSITETQLADNINISSFINDSNYELVSNKGISNGYANLDSAGKIPIAQLPNSVMEYKGVYDASTNTPILVDGTGNTGDVYRVTIAGSGVNALDFIVGDYVVYNGTIWEKQHSGADNVVSVFGRAGVVTSQVGDYTTGQVTEITNKNYQTDNQKLFNDATSSIQTQLNSKAIDANVVHLTGAEIITGDKTFQKVISNLLQVNTLSGSVFADSIGNIGTTQGVNNELAYWGSNLTLSSLSTTTYPNLSEISYVKGVTSNIQTQLDNVVGTTNLTYTPSSTNGIVNSDTGTDATIPLADATNAGLISPAEKTRIASELVPYTGATSNVNLGTFGLTTNFEQFNIINTETNAVGKLKWNDTDGTLDLGLKGGNVTLQIGQEQVKRVVNKTGVNLLEANYQVVRSRLVSEGGAAGQRLAVVLAQADSDLHSATTIGVVTETINNNAEGFITVLGEIHQINTTGSLQGETWVDGDILYLSPTIAGKLTNIKPIAPQHLVSIGQVVYAHPVNGKIDVNVQNGYELDELHNVLIPTPLNNEVLTYESSTGLWKNKSLTTILGYTPENVENKNNGALTSSAITYPTSGAVKTVTDGKQNILTVPTSGVGSNLDPTTYALQDGTILYHSTKWFTPTGAVSTSGTTVTSAGTQFTSDMVGAKLTINGEWRIIAGFTSSTVVTVASAYSQNYSGVIAGNWGVFSKFIDTRGVGSTNTFNISNFYSWHGVRSFGVDGDTFSINLLRGSSNNVNFEQNKIILGGNRPILWTNGLSGINEVGGAIDLGLRRNTAGTLEIYDGITSTGLDANRRDLLARNVISSGVVRLKNYTVSTLPTGIQGDTAYVTDATAPKYLGTLTGGGSVVCPVFYNGTAWVSH